MPTKPRIKPRPLKLEPAKRLLESPESKDAILSAFARLPEETKTLVRYHSRGYDRMEDMAAAYRLAADSNSPEDNFLTLYDADGSLMWQWCKAFVESYSPNTKSTESNRIDALIPIGYTIPRDKGLEHVLQFDPDVLCIGSEHAGARDRGCTADAADMAARLTVCRSYRASQGIRAEHERTGVDHEAIRHQCTIQARPPLAETPGGIGATGA